MKQCMITFRSVTPAQRGEGLLRRAGLSCTLQRTPRWMEQQGCGYSLLLRHQDAPMAVEILKTGQVPYRKVYLKGENNTMEELEL